MFQNNRRASRQGSGEFISQSFVTISTLHAEFSPNACKERFRSPDRYPFGLDS